MLQPVLHDEKGFTLVEFLVALVIMTVGLLGLLETANVALRQNMSNKLRSEAIVLADQMMSNEKTQLFQNITSLPSSTRQANVGNATVNYSVTETVAKMDPSTNTIKSVQFTVTWTDRGQQKTHTLTSLVSQH